jgi:hypothetical protein
MVNKFWWITGFFWWNDMHLSRHLREYDKFYKYEGLMRISEIFLLENLSINVPYYRLTMTIVCLNFYSGNLSRFQYYIVYFYAILFYFVEYGIPLSQIKIVLFILANRECLIRRWRCINILFIFEKGEFHSQQNKTKWRKIHDRIYDALLR